MKTYLNRFLGCIPALLVSLAIVSAAGPAGAVETITYYHNDIAGSPILATNAAGAVLWKENYRPYGDKLNNPPAGADNKLGFTGKPYDANTGLSYMGARYYDPVIGRFTGIDPLDYDEKNLHSFNRYTYANNNPYKYVDPDGRAAFLVIPIIGWMATGAIISGGVNAAGQYITNGEVRWNGIGGVKDAAGDGAILGPVLGAVAARSAAVAETASLKGGLTEARTARDALAGELAHLKGKAPATVTGGYNVKTGEVAARACSGGKCAEDYVADALGGAKGDVRFTEAVRPRTGAEVPVCPRCETNYGRDAFPPNTRFKSDQ